MYTSVLLAPQIHILQNQAPFPSFLLQLHFLGIIELSFHTLSVSSLSQPFSCFSPRRCHVLSLWRVPTTSLGVQPISLTAWIVTLAFSRSSCSPSNSTLLRFSHLKSKGDCVPSLCCTNTLFILMQLSSNCICFWTCPEILFFPMYLCFTVHSERTRCPRYLPNATAFL